MARIRKELKQIEHEEHVTQSVEFLIYKRLDRIEAMLIELLHPKPKSATGRINPLGGFMANPATLTIGGPGGQYTQTEWLGPNGTGNTIANIGPMSYASDNTSIATVDPASGVITQVAPGSCNISALDGGDTLTSIVPLTVLPQGAVSATGDIATL